MLNKKNKKNHRRGILIKIKIRNLFLKIHTKKRYQLRQKNQ